MSYGAQASWTATPANAGRMPIASIACLPRLGCTMSRVYLPLRAQCTQCSRPSTRNPVSSNPATSAAAMPSRTRSRKSIEPPGSAGGDPGDRAGRQRDAEQLSQRLRGALLGQELPGVQVDDDRGDPRPVLHRPLCALRCRGLGAVPATAFPLDHLMLGHRDRHFRQVEDLAALHSGDRPARQARPAPAAAAGLMEQLPVRPGHLRQRAALMPVLPARLAAGSSSAATAAAAACPAPRRTVAWMSSAASASAAPRVQRSAPVPAPAPQAPA